MNRINCHYLVRECVSIRELQKLHAQAITRGLHPQFQPLSCQFLNSYAKFGDATNAYKIYGEIPHPDIVSLTSLMSVYLQKNQPRKVISLFSELMSPGRQPDGFAVVSALVASGMIKDVGISKLIHGLVYRHGLGYETVVGNALIDMYCRYGQIVMAKMVFDEMSVRDAVSWSSMLNGFIKSVSLEDACKFFNEMPQRETVSWTVMITGHVQRKQPVRALELFHRMTSEGHYPTQITVVGVLSACADIGALDLGRVIHGYVDKMNLCSDLTVYNALIDMYAKSGSLQVAFAIFESSPTKDVFTWTSMISGFSVHGNGRRAMEVFLQMLTSGIRPNAVTFVSVLSSCSHAGLIHEGREWFQKMCKDYNFEPQIEHYGCMVDLLGRAGFLSEAENLIENMCIEPDIVIWRSLLNACLVHGNNKLAEIAGREIIKKEPDDDGVYILLWNMYASSNRWEAALEMRKKMMSRKVFKKPGCSWIELDGFVHEFLVEDKVHCLRKEIYLVLECMSKQLKMDCTTSHFEESDSVPIKDGLPTDLEK